MRHTYPLMLDVSDRVIVIIGGGKVAARKTAGLIAAGATRVRAVSLSFGADFPAGAQKVLGMYQPEHLKDAQLVFAATDDATVNDAVVRDARARGVLVSSADGDGDFSVPALMRRGEVMIAVSTGAPALAAKIRDEIESDLDPRWASLAEATAKLRPWIIEKIANDKLRREILRELASLEIVDEQQIRTLLMQRFAELR